MDEPATVTVLADPKTVIHGTVADISGQGMRLLLDAPVPVGAPLRVDVDGTMLLGECTYCYVEGPRVAAGVRLEHAVTLSQDLANLMRHLLGHSPRTAPAPLREL